MSHYLAIVEDTGPETAVGVWFPDLPGCFSGGDDVEPRSPMPAKP